MKNIIRNGIALLVLVLLLANVAVAQTPVPAAPQTKSILLSNGYAHLGNGKTIENSLIGIKNGKIVLVADATTAKINAAEWDEKIDLNGKHVYPGFILSSATIGLFEIGAVRATLDMDEVGSMIPHVRSLTAYNADSKIIPTLRTNGILLAQVAPRGGIISGTSSVFKMDGWNWEDAVLKTDDGIHMNWPAMYKRAGQWPNYGNIERNKDYEKELEELKKFISDAKAYNETPVIAEKNLRFEAMKEVIKGAKNLYIHASNVRQISEAVMFCKKMNIKKPVIVGGQDAWMLTELLKENNVPVIINRVHELPNRNDDDIDIAYKLPYLLQKAGVLYCLNYEGDMEQMGGRNLPFTAGSAVAFGLTKEEAVAAITLNAAKILGIDSYCGSLETGKDATLFVSEGDALDMKTNNVLYAYIQGMNIDLNNEQKELYHRYMKKYGK